MTCRQTLTLVVAGAVALAPWPSVSAREQQTTTRGQRGAQTTSSSQRGAQTTTTEQRGAQTTGGQRGAATTAISPRMIRGNPQGFSVILVVGDLQGAPGDGDVPPAARQALNDMKDFLPYKSYKLLDAAWIMSSFTHSTTRLRGPEEREFEIDIVASPVAATKDSPDAPNRIMVQFSLRDAMPDMEDSTPERAAGRANQEADLRAQLAEAETALKAERTRMNAGVGTRAEVERLEQRVNVLRDRLNKASRLGSRTLAQAKLGERPMMNTSFTMDVGETVVVGTSRLRSNSKALIALLTAVPQRGSRSNRD
jgi:hypothetical protein